jgi:hypothetical protein
MAKKKIVDLAGPPHKKMVTADSSGTLKWDHLVAPPSTGGTITTLVGAGSSTYSGTGASYGATSISSGGTATTVPVTWGGTSAGTTISGIGGYYSPTPAPTEVENVNNALEAIRKSKVEFLEDLVDQLDDCKTPFEFLGLAERLRKKLDRLKREK